MVLIEVPEVLPDLQHRPKAREEEQQAEEAEEDAEGQRYFFLGVHATVV